MWQIYENVREISYILSNITVYGLFRTIQRDDVTDCRRNMKKFPIGVFRTYTIPCAFQGLDLYELFNDDVNRYYYMVSAVDE